jgi:DNA-binding transcriptional ArsR family regulator
MFKELDPLLHSQLRLAIVAALMTAEEAEFTWIQEQTGATSGNLSVQLNKLKDAGYIEIEKSFRGNYPHTLCRMTNLGREKFKTYVEALKEYLDYK